MESLSRSARNDRGAVEIIVTFVGVLVLAVGALVYFVGWKGSEDARASTAWPTVSGVVVASEVRVQQDVDGDDDYAPAVQYTYSVDGEPYSASRISFGVHNSADKNGVERKVASLPVGATVEVAYDPSDHGRAVLEPGEEGWNSVIKVVGIATGAAGLAVAAGALFFMGRTRRRPAAPHG